VGPKKSAAPVEGRRGSESMMISKILTAAVIIVAMTAPSLALGASLGYEIDGIRTDRLLQRVSCNVNDDDKQALCMRSCDDEYIKASQAYGTAGRLDGPKEARKACETKCGC
jgi:hypothetical protein